ncbi:MAG: endonuclease I family protein [Acholeplasmataceae bacterium]|jgi:endonuclease I
MRKKKQPKKLTKKHKKFIIKYYKPILVILLIIFVVAIIVGYLFRDKILEFIRGPEPLTKSVTNIKITNDGVLSWDSIGNKAEYTIKINLREIKTNNTYYDFKPHKDEIKNGIEVDIFAKLPNHQISNKKSILIEYDIETFVYSISYNFIYEGYYLGIDYNMSDEDIFNNLHTIISVVTAGNGTENASYGEARNILVKSDLEPKKDNLWGIYDNSKILADWGNGNIFEREHVWPRSRLGLPDSGFNNSTRDQRSDPHNLRAIIRSTNASRSNRYFTSGSGIKGYTVGTNEYYPGNDHRGDVARILLYMAVRYKNILSLVETPNNYSYTPEGAQMGRLSLLLKWHEIDPVDEFELNRNEVIFEYQGNRNPFIDHPELFERIYQHILDISLMSRNPYKTLEIIIKSLKIQTTTHVGLKKRYLL